MAYNKTQLNILVNEHTHKLFMEYVKDMDIPVSVLGAWLIQTHINEVPRNRGAIIAYHQKKLKERSERWDRVRHQTIKKEEFTQQSIPNIVETPVFIEVVKSFDDTLKTIMENQVRLREDLEGLKRDLGA